MKEKTIKRLFGICAVLALAAIFYIGGLYERYLISDIEFGISFTLLAAALWCSAVRAGATKKEP